MKFNPRTMELRSADGMLIKRLSCPFNIKPSALKLGDIEGRKLCRICSHAVLETALMSEEEVISMIEDSPETCLIVYPDQKNVQIVGE